MNKSILKDYAPKARTAFIQAITDKAALYGITENSVLPCEVSGDFAFIDGRPYPRIVNTQRGELLSQINEHSFSYVMEEIAYTWFNRFAAIRFMEVNGYLSHGYGVLSHPEGHNIPEIVEKAQFITMTGLDKEEVIQLKMAGDKDDELYRGLLIAQCNELSSAMPFLFEKVDDPTELLLPDNLLHTGSIIRDMVETIPEEDWREVEIIGWLYQFYISEKKDVLIKAKKAYKSEDIPAVTQLFTPNWIVKYLIQNSLGAKWMRTYPTSSLKAKMEYYIEPAEQTPEVNEELRRITPSSLNPEELTVMDPACGSGHILVEAYDILKEIYLERGYRRREIPQLILDKNLFGLEIDDRAAQLAGFALMMKARRDDSGIFQRNVKPNVLVIKSVTGEGAKGWLEVFENADTFGSLIRIPEGLKEKLPEIKKEIDGLEAKGDLLSHNMIEDLRHLVRQTELLARKYDVVVANPPYMGGRFMNAKLKAFVNKEYADTKSDLFAVFIMRIIDMAASSGSIGLMTPFTWMFLSSYKKLRERILFENTLTSLVRPEYHAFFDSAYVPICGLTLSRISLPEFRGGFIELKDFYGADLQPIKALEAIKNQDCGWFYRASATDFRKIPGSPIAYWVSENVRMVFEKNMKLGELVEPKQGLITGDNDRFIRFWHEVSALNTAFMYLKSKKWYPFNKGGDYRKWYGNAEYLVNWERDGYEIKNFRDKQGRLRSRPQNLEYNFRNHISWSLITSGNFSVRYYSSDFAFNVAGISCFPETQDTYYLLACLNTKMANLFTKIINPTINSNVGDVSSIPVIIKRKEDVDRIVKQMLNFSKSDWDSYETSWDFSEMPLLRKKGSTEGGRLSEPETQERRREDSSSFLCFSTFDSLALSISYNNYRTQCQQMTDKMKELEEENNRIFIEAYGLQDEITSDVPIGDITLFANPKCKYKGDLSETELEERFKEDTMKELISYAVGCMMGRYSLDESGLIYAHSGNIGFDASKYKTFPADSDGIIPITDTELPDDDDAALRFFRFIETAWAKEGLEDNLDFIADAIGRKARESSRDAIRRYFVNDFFKGHLKTYKKRPIYWLFSSGKQKAFQALVYVHRYNEGTLSRMRTEYVLPLQSRLSRHIEHLEKDRDAASSTSAANKIQREIDKLRKQREELLRFDEKLRHYADMRIKLDLDDGVKVNYDKFGDLLAEVKAVTGKK